MTEIQITKAEKDTPLAAELVRFVEDFSWKEVREHMLWLLKEWKFTDWEGVFVAVADGGIVGMATIMRTDYYPLPDVFPWISSVFVTERYRGRRISEKLIAYANSYARELGFHRTYIPSGFFGLYEKYGYRHVGDIVNYGGGTDHLFVKDIAKAEFRTLVDFPRGTMHALLRDAYAYDARNEKIWNDSWHGSDDFFYDNPEIARKYSLVTCLDGQPIGFVTWDPRHRPEYVEIGHNGVREKYKRKGYGHAQLAEAIRRIREYPGLQRIVVCTNANLAAPKNYESVGFCLSDRKPNTSQSSYTGDYLYYEITL